MNSTLNDIGKMMDATSQKDVLRSAQFDDVYFSAQDGLAETRHVFLDGNGLPAAWQGHEVFRIAETGFGTGLNFLAAWSLFRKEAQPGPKLVFRSVELYPLGRGQIAQALERWHGELGAEMEAFLEAWPEEPPAQDFVHDFGGGISLRVDMGDANTVLPQWKQAVDCWFLDGFKPASNPQMWSDAVLDAVARCSRPGTCFATFTAAGFVKRALAARGFDVRKVPGFGRKREMLVGVFKGTEHEKD